MVPLFRYELMYAHTVALSAAKGPCAYLHAMPQWPVLCASCLAACQYGGLSNPVQAEVQLNLVSSAHFSVSHCLVWLAQGTWQ